MMSRLRVRCRMHASCSRPSRPAVEHEPDQQGLLEVEAVGGLGDDQAAGAVEDARRSPPRRGGRAGSGGRSRRGGRGPAASALTWNGAKIAAALRRPRAPGPCSPRRRCRPRRRRSTASVGSCSTTSGTPGNVCANRRAEVGRELVARRGRPGRTRRPSSAEASASDRATLLPSPTKTSLTPSRPPKRLLDRQHVGHRLARVGQRRTGR